MSYAVTALSGLLLDGGSHLMVPATCNGDLGPCRVPPPTERATKTIVLAHRIELLEQAASRIREAAPHLSVTIEAARWERDSPEPDLV